MTFPCTSTIPSIVNFPEASTLSSKLATFVLLASVTLPVAAQPRMPFVTGRHHERR